MRVEKAKAYIRPLQSGSRLLFYLKTTKGASSPEVCSLPSSPRDSVYGGIPRNNLSLIQVQSFRNVLIKKNERAFITMLVLNMTTLILLAIIND